MLPTKFRKYRQENLATWDIETAERKHERDNEAPSMATQENAIHKAISIGVSSNLPGHRNRYFVRKTSAQEDGEDMVSKFLEHLFVMAADLKQSLPKEIIQAAKRLKDKLAGQQFSKGACKERSLLYHLNNYKKLSVFGFNSGI